MKNILKVLRAERDWTQAELARRLDVSRESINAIETGRYDPSLPLAFEIAVETSDEVCANCETVIVWLPDCAVASAELRLSRSGFELDPSFAEKIPLKSVSACTLVVSVDKSVPKEERAVSCAFKAVN